jgi:hypothetical protein
MLNMTEVYYHNNKLELQKIELYNINTREFLQKQSSRFQVLCVIERGAISFTTPAFNVIEQEIASLMESINQPS